jgi:hypothetical protein
LSAVFGLLLQPLELFLFQSLEVVAAQEHMPFRTVAASASFCNTHAMQMIGWILISHPEPAGLQPSLLAVWAASSVGGAGKVTLLSVW